MALNPNVYMPPAMAYATRERDRPKPAPVPYLGEYFFASRDTCHVSISGGGDDRFKHSGKGRVFLTNYRMIYLPDKPQGEFRGIELPLLFIQDFDVCQPILGANYLHGHCRRVDDPMGSPMLKWKLRFINGGMGTMVPLFYSTVAYIRTASQRQAGDSHQQAPVVDEQKVDEMYKPPPFVANAVVDPNDPTIVYVVEQPPVPQEEPAVEPKRERVVVPRLLSVLFGVETNTFIAAGGVIMMMSSSFSSSSCGYRVQVGGGGARRMGVSSFFGQGSLSSSVNVSSLRRSRDRSSTCVIRASSSPVVSAASTDDVAPLMVRAARGEKIERPPCWMMRQAGRYQKAYRDLAEKYPSFRARSEQTDLIVEISLQPWNSFKPDGVILFSDILTPLPACGVPFEIDDNKGPLIDAPFRSIDRLKELTPIDLDQLSFVGESLSLLKQEVQGQAAVLGFVGCPWTLATYVVEGASSALYKNIKSMIYSQPDLLDGILSHIADQIAVYAKYQAASGADCVMMFDSWGGQLPPKIWEQWSLPYIKRIVQSFKAEYPNVPLTLYANGSGGLLERMATSGVDVVGLDWTVDMADARARLGPDLGVQGNVDPAVLFASQDAIEAAVKDCIQSAGPRGHVLNLGHGVLVGTPEDNVAFMFDLAKKSTYSS